PKPPRRARLHTLGSLGITRAELCRVIQKLPGRQGRRGRCSHNNKIASTGRDGVDMKSFSNKVAAVTGAGSGIGRALALNLAQQGCHLAIADVNAKGLEETRDLLAQYPVKVTTEILDVSDRAGVYAWADKIVADHGQVNLIFNNA